MEREGRKEERRARGTRREKLERGAKGRGKEEGCAAQTITDGHRTLFFILHYPCSAPLRSIMPAPRINDELGDELPPPLLSNAHLREHTDKHRSSVPDSRGIYPALFFQSARYVERARFRSRVAPRGSLDGEMSQGEYLWNMCFLLGKKKGKRKNKIIPRSIFSKLVKMKEDTKMSLLVFFFFFLKPEIDS